MKYGLWLSRRQVRWLIVLLALLPLIPTILLVQVMLQTALRERDSAVSEITSMYRGQLSLLVEKVSNDSTAEKRSDSTLSDYLLKIFGDEVSLKVVNSNGQTVFQSQTPLTRDAIVYQIVSGEFKDWIISLDKIADIPENIEEQHRETFWHALLIVLGVVSAAGIVWFTVHRRLRIDDLRSDVVTTISHEIKTPVAAMKVLLETLEEGNADDQTQKDYINLIGKENERVRELADQFLTFSRLERGQIRVEKAECNLSDLLAEQVELISPQFSKRDGSIQLNCPEAFPVTTDRTALQIIVANLLENSLKYGGEQPCAVVSTQAVPGNKQVEIAVEDNGSGIAKEDRRAVFRRFYRGDSKLHESSTGVGLGLAICRKFAKLLRARLRVERSEKLGGAAMILTLPTT